MSILKFLLSVLLCFFCSCSAKRMEYSGAFPPWLRDFGVPNGYWEEFGEGEGATWLAIDEHPNLKAKIAWLGSSNSISIESVGTFLMMPIGHGEFNLTEDRGRAVSLNIKGRSLLLMYNGPPPILPLRNVEDIVDWINFYESDSPPVLFELKNKDEIDL